VIRGGVAQGVEEAAAAAGVAPAFGVQAFEVGAHVEKVGPCLVVELGRPFGARQMSFAAVGELEFGAFTAVGETMSSMLGL